MSSRGKSDMALRALALLALCGLAAAGRLAPDTHAAEEFFVQHLAASAAPAQQQQLKVDDGAFLGLDIMGLHPGFEGPVSIVAQFFVPPSKHNDFRHEFDRFRAAAAEASPKVALHLAKPMSDNIKLVVHMMAQDHQDIHDVMESDAFREFRDFVTGANIAVVHQPMVHEGSADDCKASKARRGPFASSYSALLQRRASPGAASASAAASAAAAAAFPLRPGGGGGERPRVMRVVSRFEVPPGSARAFVDAWQDLACEVATWPGHRRFSLSSVLGSNSEFVSYAAWDVPEAPPSRKERRAKERAMGRFLDAVARLGVSFRSEPLLELPPPGPDAGA